MRPYDFAQKMKKFDITIFAASYQHFSGENLIEDGALFKEDCAFSVPFVFVNTVESNSSGWKRCFNMVEFYLKMFRVGKIYAKKNGRPDLIIASSPHPLTMLAGIKIAKKWGIPCICEIRDLWPEAIFAGSEKLTHGSALGKALVWGERWMYKNADALVFTKEGDTDYIKEQGWDKKGVSLEKCFYINNGVDTAKFEECNSSKQSDAFRVVYAGTIRPVNDIDTILDAAKLLIDKENIQFMIYGDGNQVDRLRKRIVDEKITNIVLKGFVPKEKIPSILGSAAVNILNYSSEKYNWSRGSSSNKLFEYMASGKPIISTVKTGYSIINRYECGIELESCTPIDLARAITQIHDMPPESYLKMGENGKYGAKNFDLETLSAKYEQLIEKYV
ncbi:glycosyltransferase family 4 protein [Listeria grandensis]|uniref:Glycosyltransferase family 4 protein n=2 Tax=Listeria grandensis TaxID=1494963 RepID=A0A7X0Y2K0_9LIST|nr:glycosyltransferase family 4 protein [Listeria grandensis]